MPENCPTSQKSKFAFWRRLFGSRKSATEKAVEGSIEGLVADGKAREVTDEMVRVNMLHDSLLDSVGSDDPMALFESMTGGFVDRKEIWRIGESIPEDVYRKFADSAGELYAVSRLEDGKKRTQLMKRELWEQTRKAMGLS